MNWNESEIGSVLEMGALIPLIDRALQDLSAGRVVQPVREVVPVQDHGGFFGSMPALLRAPSGASTALGIKLVSFYPLNAERGIPTHHAVILLFDPETGVPLAQLDGRLITEMRTAAASAAATNVLAKRSTRVLSLLGSGVQATSHLEAMRLVRDFEEVRVWSRRFAQAERFADRNEGVVAFESVAEAVREADVICTLTSATDPILRGAWLKPGAHVNGVGACRPDQRELDRELVQTARLFVDSQAAASRESGDVILNQGRVLGEIGAVLSGAIEGRTDDEQITLFKSLGLAVEDVVTASWVHQQLHGAVDRPIREV